MEPLFELLGAWWWVAPTVVGLGAVSYGVLTTGRRRARRLELDAARREVATAHAELVTARADVKSAHAQVLAAQAHRGAAAAGALSVPQARQALHDAKHRQRVATLTLRAKRSAVRAARAQLTAPSHLLPLAKLMGEHDAVTARWLEYETDVAKAIAFPQMSDVRHPPTAVFLHAQREARRVRPESERSRITPEEYLAYRDAVRALEAAFLAAEQDAWRTASGETAPAQTFTWTTRLADGIVRLPAVVSDSVRAVVDQAAAASSAPTPPAQQHDGSGGGGSVGADQSGSHPPPAVWPVPSRTSRPPTQG